MLTLTVKSPDCAVATYPIPEPKGLVCGRGDDCDVVLKSGEASRRHARIFAEAGHVFVEDLQSQNGVFVNGKRITGRCEISSSASIEIAEFRMHLSGAAQGGVDAGGPFLRGVGKEPNATVRLGARAIVGRDLGCEVVLNDDSVSRKHAELRRTPQGSYVVVDLGSANGTFVGGRRIARDTSLTDGQKVRFGEVELIFVSPTATPSKRGQKRQRRLLGLGATLLVFFAGMYAVKHRTQTPQEGARGTTVDPLERGIEFLDEERYDEAARELAVALDNDPINERARTALRRAKREAELKQVIHAAESRTQLGHEEEALKLLLTVDPDSRAYSRARIQALGLAALLSRRFQQSCQNACRNSEWTRAAETCARALDLRCAVEPDEGTLRLLRDAEQHLTKPHVAWSCPADTVRWFGGTATSAATEAAPDSQLAERYREPALREAASRYAQGDLDGARHALSALDRNNASAEAMREAFQVIDGRYRDGQATFLRGDLEGASQRWREALAADARILPSGLRSFYGDQMRSQLAQAYAKKGEHDLDSGAYTSAYQSFATGFDVARNDPAISDGLARLDKIADGLADSGSCDDVQTALKITRDDSPAHQKAKKKLGACN